MILIRLNSQAEPWSSSRTLNRPSASIFALFFGWCSESWDLASRIVHGKTVVSLLLSLIVVASGVGAVYSVHLNRHLFMELQTLQKDLDRYESEWSQLLLEESALGAHSRVEQLAVKKLGMQIPAVDQMQIVR